MVDVLAFGAHPDDVEFGCGAILLKMVKQKKSVAIVDLTSGEMGSHGTKEIREQEAKNAAGYLDAPREFLQLPDTALFDTEEIRLKLVKVIRKYRPKLILAPNPHFESNHPDHSTAARLIRIAARYARFKSILPEIQAHRVEGVLHYLYPCFKEINFIVDVSQEIEEWKKMMLCHESQMKTLNYLEYNLKKSAYLGSQIGVEYGQALMNLQPIEIDDPMVIAKGAREI